MEPIAQRVEGVALDRADALLRHMERRRDFGDLLRLAAEAEMAGDDGALTLRQRVDRVVDLELLLVLDCRGFRIGSRSVDDERCKARAVSTLDRRLGERGAHRTPDTRSRVGREIGAPIERVIVDRIEQPERSLLDEIIDRQAQVPVAQRDRHDPRQVAFDEAVA